jgi:hypothetical protein
MRHSLMSLTFVDAEQHTITQPKKKSNNALSATFRVNFPSIYYPDPTRAGSRRLFSIVMLKKVPQLGYFRERLSLLGIDSSSTSRFFKHSQKI